jgi:hypothetical protein
MLYDPIILTELESHAFWVMYGIGFAFGLTVLVMPIGIMTALRIVQMGK